ncbi:MAG: pyridoxal-dependent decarboxylase, partial [Stellaceae bacterium]
MTPDEFRKYGHRLIDWIADYQASVAKRPVMAQVKPGDIKKQLPAAPPEHAEPMEAVLADLDRIVVPGLSLWQHPRFFGYFPGNGLPAGVLADFVSTGLGVLGLAWQSSPAVTEVEEVMADWVRQIVGLSVTLCGVILESASR